jgi:SLOG in TRPM, prokaryote/SMODS and SLOG-associating 2TM effector domain 1/Protein of unknown function (DUF4231)
MSANPIKEPNIVFPNQNSATAVSASAQSKAEEIIKELDLKPHKTVMLILGGADGIDETSVPRFQRLQQMFGRGIARAAVEADAVSLDGGTAAGVMKMMGEGVAGRGFKSQLIGVAPARLVSYPGGPAEGTPLEPNHSHFVLVAGSTWGSETSTMFNLAKALITDKTPGVAILAGGGQNTAKEVLQAVRQNLPLVVVEGSGGLADEIAEAWKKRATPPDHADPQMAEIIADGDIHLHLLDNPVKGIERLITRELGSDNVLMQAWETFADYDHNAKRQQKRFGQIQLASLIVGVLGTALAIIQQVYAPRDGTDAHNLIPTALTDSDGHLDWKTTPWWVIHQSLIIIPILLTVLIAAANRFKQGNKWLLLRAGAESIKREIYRYRTRSMDYKQQPEQQLSQRVEDITRRTMRTDVNLSALSPYDKDRGFPPDMYGAKGGDDGFSYLTPDRYVEVRLGDQRNYFQKKCVKLERQLKALYWLTFVLSGVGAYLAAVNQQAWIALTTALVAAIGTYLGYMQTENTLTKYNQAATDLANVKAWWNALPAEDQARQENIDSLVEHTEQVLQSELDGWVQQMQNALAELRKDQEPKPEKEENTEPKETSSSTAGQADNKGGNAQANNQPGPDAKPPAQPDAGEQPAGEGEPEAGQPEALTPANEAAGEAGDEANTAGANETADSTADNATDNTTEEATPDEPDGEAGEDAGGDQPPPPPGK